MKNTEIRVHRVIELVSLFLSMTLVKRLLCVILLAFEVLVGIPQTNPMVYRLDATSFTSWYTTTKPTTDDGKVYIRLGYLSGLAAFSLFADHPVFWFKNGYFRPYNPA